MNLAPGVLFRTDADSRIGSGHLNRCLSLAQKFREAGHPVTFVLRHADLAAQERIASFSFAWVRIPADLDYSRELPWLLEKFPTLPGSFVLDVSHPLTFGALDPFSSYVEALRKAGILVTLLDGMGEQCLATKLPIAPDLVILPYFGAKGLKMHSLAGEKFAIFDPAYQKAQRPRKIRPSANRLLFTFGGSDPNYTTLKALDALPEVVRAVPSLQTRVIVGPSYSDQLKRAIHEHPEIHSGRVEMIDAPSCLLEHLEWCDLAVSSSGLTKYELALTGTPALLISIDETHARINQEFVRMGSAIDLGVHSEVSPMKLGARIVMALGDEKSRKELSAAGQRLLDAEGTTRILSELNRLRETYAEQRN
ncbi:MAG: PseG/SpsG family protein [Bdellovibrionota bacterium]